jgi:hypothetical protein
MKHGQCHDDVMAKLADIILNTEPMLNDDEYAAPTFGADFQVLEDDAEDTESTPEVVPLKITKHVSHSSLQWRTVISLPVIQIMICPRL